MVTAARGHAETASALIAAGAKANLRDALKKTAADYAADAGHADLAQTIRQAEGKSANR
jgi:ankyrin repeat protein